MSKKSVKPEKRLSKKEIRKQKFEEMRRKQLDEAYKYPFCRRCRRPLPKKWAKKLKKEGQMPLCKTCYPKMMKQFEKLIDLWQKFSKR